MDKQEFEKQRQQILEGRKQFYRENPEVANWVKTKKILRGVVMGYWILHSVLSCLVMVQFRSGGIGMEIFKLLFQLLWLCVFINPEGGWRINLVFYFWALMNLAMLANYLSDVTALLKVISYYPLYGVVIAMEFLVPFLLLFIALYLTAFPKHRALSEQAEAIRKKTAELINEAVK